MDGLRCLQARRVQALRCHDNTAPSKLMTATVQQNRVAAIADRLDSLQEQREQWQAALYALEADALIAFDDIRAVLAEVESLKEGIS